MIEVGTAAAAPGERAIGRLTVGEDRTGAPATLPVAIVNGETDGDTLYIQAASDGDELNGVGVIANVTPQLDPQRLAGAVIVVGIVNTFGFQGETHRNPVDDTKINRTYPGDPDGSSSERIAAATFEVACQADLILDLHQGSTSRMIDECRVRCGPGHTLHEDCLELAKVFGCGHLLDQKGPDGQLARVGPDEGIPTVDPELGGSVGWDQKSVKVGVNGVFNVLRYYGFLPGAVELGAQIRARNFEQYAAPAGGLARLDAELGERVEPGDAIFTITSVFGDEREVVTAADEGVVWRARRLPQVASGEYVCTLGTTLDTY